MLLAIALVIFGWSLASLYIYLEKKYPKYERETYFIFILLFSAGGLLILVTWFMLGIEKFHLSDLWK
jgi:hypothetical protein